MATAVGLFVDLSNLFFCAVKKFGPKKKVDYERLLDYVREDHGQVYRAVAYGTQSNGEAREFITALRKIGYDTKYKQPDVLPDKSLDRFNWSVGICLDVVRMIGRLDAVVIASANPNLVPLVEWVKEQGVRVIVLACGISKKLKEVADQYVEIESDLLEGREDEDAGDA